jgi:hypothetical protein
MRFTVEISVPDDAVLHPVLVADQLLDFLCDGGDGGVEFPPTILSIDSVEPS